MWRLTKGLLWIFDVILIALIGGLIWGRLRPPNQAQAAALVMLQQEQSPTRGHNAWATFWLLDYDVPAGKRDEAYARERTHLFDWAGKALSGDASAPDYDSLVARQYPKLPVIAAADRDRLCHVNDVDCLGKVREQVQPLRALLARQRMRLARSQSLTADDFLWGDTPLNFSTPLPPFVTAENLQLTDTALDFVEGRQQQALSRVCGDVRTLRQLHAHTNSMIGAMVMVSWTEATERLFADMLAELPVDQSAPANCEAAFASVTQADVDMCAPMQREYQLLLAGMAPVDPAKAAGLKRVERHHAVRYERYTCAAGTGLCLVLPGRCASGHAERPKTVADANTEGWIRHVRHRIQPRWRHFGAGGVTGLRQLLQSQ
ncbi:MAG: hypothetical protein ABI227_10040 [Rhodanobacter sp.]